MAMFRTKWNLIGLPENSLLLIIIIFLMKFFYYLFLIKFEKYQREILGPSSPDSVPIIEKKKKNPAKKVDFDQNKINLGDKTEEVTLAWDSILKLLLYN